MMGKDSFLRRLTSKLSGLDNRFVAWNREHSNLLLVVVNLVLAEWALTTGHGLYVFGMALIGAVGYFAGLLVASSFTVIVLGIDVSFIGVAHISLSLLIIEIIGYLNITWLGFRHKRLKEAQRRTMDEKHPDQIMSWTAVNEVRTSLAAIRYLLFPLHGENASLELQKATSELSRLEHLFRDIEKRQSPDGPGRY